MTAIPLTLHDVLSSDMEAAYAVALHHDAGIHTGCSPDECDQSGDESDGDADEIDPYWHVQAIRQTRGEGWALSRQVPTISLSSDVLGIVTAVGAARIACDVLSPAPDEVVQLTVLSPSSDVRWFEWRDGALVDRLS